MDKEIPPKKAVASIPPTRKICVTMLEVVVFPCVPATATHFMPLEIMPKTAARFKIGYFFS